jgi:hypothetical protein
VKLKRDVCNTVKVKEKSEKEFSKTTLHLKKNETSMAGNNTKGDV